MSRYAVEPRHQDWPAADVERLRALWAEPGLSTKEIGRLLGGRTKDSIVGKAHRLNLPAKPNPIGRVRGEVRAPAPRVFRPKPARPGLEPQQRASLARRPAAPPAPPPPLAVIVAVPPPPLSCCSWVLNDRRPWLYCGAPAMGRRVYCAAHSAVAYTGRGAGRAA